jgi:RNA polymerase sigma-70 factor, ECF subfamily
MSPYTEQELLKSAKTFDLNAIGVIYDQYSPGIYRYAMRLLGDECLVEDCVADTFSRFLKALRASKGPETNLQAYLYRIAHNWITDSYRRQTPTSVELYESLEMDSSKGPDAQLDQKIENHQLRLALRALTPDQRLVISLRFIEEWPNEEVAAAMQKPVGAVKALQHRAMDTLRRLIKTNEKASLYDFE